MKQLTDEVFAQVRDALEMNRVMAQDSEGNYTKEVTPKKITAALAALDTAQPVQVNAGYGELEAVMSAEFESHGFGAPESNKREYGRFRVGFASGWHSALTAAKQAQPEPSEMTTERESYIAGLESRTHEMRKKIEQLDYELRVARSSQERATYTPPKIIDPDAPHPCFN